MILDKEQVYKFLPHRPPFLFIDTIEKIDLPQGVLELEEISSRDLIGTCVTANFNVPKDLSVLEGHFPGNPILPGVIHVEMMAQAAAFSLLGMVKLDINRAISIHTILMGVSDTKFRKLVTPGMKLEISSKLIKSRGEVAIYDCEVYSGGEKVSQAQITAKITFIKE